MWSQGSMKRIALSVLLMLLTSSLVAQDDPVIKSQVTMNHYSVLATDDPGESRTAAYAVIWFDAGFGRYNFDVRNPPQLWKQRNDDGTPVEYVWFFYDPNITSGPMDADWFCLKSDWDLFVAGGTKADLLAKSFNFANFHQGSGFEVRLPEEQISWQRNPRYSIGYRSDTIFFVVQKGSEWEWRTVDQIIWQQAQSQLQAEQAAEGN
jgi:hypothetical protein